MANFVPNSLIYFDVSQKIIGKSKIKNKERVINNNFEEYSNKKKTIHINVTLYILANHVKCKNNTDTN